MDGYLKVVMWLLHQTLCNTKNEHYLISNQKRYQITMFHSYEFLKT